MYYKSILNYSVYDFLSFCKMNEGYRFAGLITDKQMTSLSSNNLLDHWKLMSNLGNCVFPDMNGSYDDGDFDQYITIFGEKNSIDIVLPDSLTSEQYELLLKIIDEIKTFEKENGIIVFQKNYNFFLEGAKAKVVSKQLTSLRDSSPEVLFGVTLTNVINGKERLIPSILDDYDKDGEDWEDWEADWNQEPLDVDNKNRHI